MPPAVGDDKGMSRAQRYIRNRKAYDGSWARDMFGLERLGHGGTLDPFATGVLPLMAGKSMKLTKKILTHNKTYICVFRFASEPDSKMLEEVMSNMTGRVFNVPPEISAVKIQVRSRRIFTFEKLDIKNNQMVARVECEAGTYIRTMARDMGLLLNMKVGRKRIEWNNPQNINVQFAPCQKPLTRKMIKMFLIDFHFPFCEPPSGIYR
jgi:hypothetical protein